MKTTNNLRKGLGKGQGSGYYNLMPMDAHIHSLSAKGISTVAKPVFGKKIVDARQLTKKEVDDEGWYRSTTALILDDGTLVYPSQDDEGNDSGALFGKTPEGQAIRLGIQGSDDLNAKGKKKSMAKDLVVQPMGMFATYNDKQMKEFLNNFTGEEGALATLSYGLTVNMMVSEMEKEGIKTGMKPIGFFAVKTKDELNDYFQSMSKKEKALAYTVYGLTWNYVANKMNKKGGKK